MKDGYQLGERVRSVASSFLWLLRFVWDMGMSDPCTVWIYAPCLNPHGLYPDVRVADEWDRP